MYNELDISLKYEDLYDAKTRLKELFDYFSKVGTERPIGKLIYENERVQVDEQHRIQKVWISREIQGPHGRQKQLMGEGNAALLPDAQQKAADVAIKFLNRHGYIKPVPEFYRTFC